MAAINIVMMRAKWTLMKLPFVINRLLEQSHELEVRLYDLKSQTTSLSAELAIMVR